MSEDSLKPFSDGLFSDETDLVGFDGLWGVDYKEAKNFLQLKQDENSDKQREEFDLLQKELDEKEFEVQKLQWQLSEREKELKNLYDELHRLLELNKKLNKQLDDFEELSRKQEKLLQILSTDPYKLAEPVLPSFN